MSKTHSTKVLILSCILTGAVCFTLPLFSTFDASRKLHYIKHHPSVRLSATIDRPASVADFDVSEDAPRNIGDALASWVQESGLQIMDGFELTSAEDDNDREVYASTTTNLSTGQPILFVPESLILSSNKAIEELRHEEAQRYLASCAHVGPAEFRQYYLMLKLLQEIQNGPSSPWYAWLDSLPRFFTNAASMTEFCLLCLPPLMKKLAREEREKQQQLSSLDAVRHVPFLDDAIKENDALLKWAYQIVVTRAVETKDGDLCIVPMADYFNHGSDYTEIEPTFDEDGNYYAYATYDVPAGQALRISYADPRNPSYLLARYGFLDEECPATYCKLLPPTVNQDMLDLGYSHNRMLFYKSGEVADEVWDIFLYQYLDSTHNVDDRKALMRTHREEDYDAKLALHETYYPQTSKALLEHVDTFLEDIEKLLQKAETVGVSDPNSVYIKYEHPRLPLIHRHNLFVKETFQNVRNRYTENHDSDDNWREATRVTIQECDEIECAIKECMQYENGEWACEGGLEDYNPDGSEKQKTQEIISSQ